MAATEAKRQIVIDFTQDLFEEVEKAAGELQIDRSSLVRVAVEQYIKDFRRKRLDQQLIDGYAANTSLSRHTSEEFSFVDSELI